MSPELKIMRQEGEPLYPKVLWNRPVNRAGAGRLLLVGSSAGNFSITNDIFLAAQASGAGECGIVFPDSLRGTIGATGIGFFVPSSPSGSIGTGAVGEILHLATDFDGVALGGELSNNSQTAIAIENIISKFDGPLIVYSDTLHITRLHIDKVANRDKTLIILTMAELVSLAKALRIPIVIRDDGALAKAAILAEVAKYTTASYLLFGHDIVVVAGGNISLTNLGYVPEPAVVYALASIFWLQNQSKPFEGLTAAAYILSQFDDRQVYTVPQACAKIRQIIDIY